MTKTYFRLLMVMLTFSAVFNFVNRIIIQERLADKCMGAFSIKFFNAPCATLQGKKAPVEAMAMSLRNFLLSISKESKQLPFFIYYSSDSKLIYTGKTNNTICFFTHLKYPSLFGSIRVL